MKHYLFTMTAIILAIAIAVNAGITAGKPDTITTLLVGGLAVLFGLYVRSRTRQA